MGVNYEEETSKMNIALIDSSGEILTTAVYKYYGQKIYQ